MQHRRYIWIAVALLWVVALLNYLDRQVIFSLFPPLKLDLRATDLQLGLLGTAFLWVYGVLSPASGFLADRYDRTKVILFSLIVWSGVTWLTAMARSFNELLAARALMGLSEAAYLPAALALIADYHGPTTRSRATGIHQSGLYAGIALGGLAGGWIGEHYGWRAVFTLLGAAGIGYAAVLYFVLKPPPVAQRAPALESGFLPAIRELMRLRGFVPLLTANTLGAMAYWVSYAWLPLFLYERFGMSLTRAGFTATFYIQTASACGILAGGWLADCWCRTNSRGRVLTQAIGFSLAAPALFFVATAPTATLLIGAMIVFGLGRGFFDCNLMPVLSQLARPQLRATGYGVLNFASTMVGGLMTAAAGALKSTLGLGPAFALASILLLAAALTLYCVPITESANPASAIEVCS